MAKRIALFPGSFDPFTKGHEDIVLRGLILFDEIIIALGYNTQKSSRYFEIDKMIELIESAFEKYPNIKVVKFSELTAEFARKNGARFLLRGFRNTRILNMKTAFPRSTVNSYPELESVFLITTPKLAWISSSIVREVHRYGGDVSGLLPYKLKG